jgi:hypothetical protein
LAGSSDHEGLARALTPNGGARAAVIVAETECCTILRDCQEPPDADPHVRWCGGRGGNPPGYPILRLSSESATALTGSVEMTGDTATAL